MVEPPLAIWHRTKAVELLEDSYEALIEHQSSQPVTAADGGQTAKSSHTAYCWFHRQPAHQGGKQPIIDDLGTGQLYYFFKTDDDAQSFMNAYAEQYGVSDLENYELVEAELGQVDTADEILDLDVEEIEELEKDAVEDTSDYSEERSQSNISDY